MRAYIADDGAPNGMRWVDIRPPQRQSPSHALVEVHATSLNRGELVNVGTWGNGTTLGWDLAGVVVEAAADGSGPPAGTPVYGWCANGSWAELVSVSTATITARPEGLVPSAAAAIGVAGVTALYALRRGGSLLGRTVIVTGAAGGVGRMAVQLAVLSGASVIAVVGTDARRVQAVLSLGLDAVTIAHALEPTGPRAHLILESVGGESLSAAFRRVAHGGCIVTLGRSSREAATVPPEWFFRDARLEGLEFAPEAHRDPSRPTALQILGALTAAERVDPGIGLERDWSELPAAAQALLERKVAGRAVLTITSPRT